MKKIRAAIVGYGNIGKYALQALESAPDFEVAGIVRRSGADNKPAELNNYPVVKEISELQDVDVAILSTPTRSVEEYAKQILEAGINTVDSFDIHSQIVPLRRSLNESAKKGNAVSIISAGWDPGSDSVVRTLLQAIAPNGITYTNFGPGMSMGHTVAVKAIEGVQADARFHHRRHHEGVAEDFAHLRGNKHAPFGVNIVRIASAHRSYTSFFEENLSKFCGKLGGKDE